VFVAPLPPPLKPPAGGDQHVDNILAALALDPPRGAVPLRISVEQQRRHHRRLVRHATMAVRPIRLVDRGEVHLLDRGKIVHTR
jgi:uncharacterized protein (DUF58 family)